MMDSRLIGILPFLSFKDKVIKLNDFLLFTDSTISEINELTGDLKQILTNFSCGQKEFIFEVFNNSEADITFVLPTSADISKDQLELFFEVLFFYLHKGGKFTNQFFTPNAFCREDFKNIVIEFIDDENIGDLIIKKKWKFQIDKSLAEFIISPVGCENIVIQYEASNYLFRNIDLDSNSNVFQHLYECVVGFSDFHVIRAVTFYNRAMSCELRDEQRFVWLSSALESFLQIGKAPDKKAKIKEEINQIMQSKNFILLDKENISKNVSDLITVIYDYRSSYIHGSDMTTKSQEIENELKQKLGKLDCVSALMNLTSYLLVHNLIPDVKFESNLNWLFNNQEVFNKTLRIFVKGADETLKEFNKIETRLTIFSFLQSDLQTLSFNMIKVEKCMSNILHVFAKFAATCENNEVAIQIQQKIDSINFKDKNKFAEWNSYFNITKQITPNLEVLYLCKSVFQKLHDLCKFDTSIY